jgi:ATP-dependent exoDNAse (exonuclease V) beta subunit
MKATSTHYEIKSKPYLRVSRLLELTGESDFSSIPLRDKNWLMERGTARHEMFEHIERGIDGQHTYDARIEEYRPGHAKFLRETGFEAIKGGIEKGVSATWEDLGFSQRNYPEFKEAGLAGRLDRLGMMQGRMALCDYKGHSIPPSTAAQTALYLMMMPQYLFCSVDRYGIAVLPNGKYLMSLRYPDSDRARVLALISKYLSQK